MSGGAIRIEDTASYSRNSPEYKLGLAQLAEWHERCRAKRLGIKRRAKDCGVSVVRRARKRKAVAK